MSNFQKSLPNMGDDGLFIRMRKWTAGNSLGYRAHHSMIDRYRNDIYGARTIASIPLQNGVEAGQAVGRGVKAVGNATEQVYDAARDKAETGVRRAGEKMEQLRDDTSRLLDKVTHPGSWFGSQADPIPLLSDPGHPGNGLFKQAQTGMQAIDARFDRASDHRTDNAAGFLAVKAHGAGMARLDVMDLNDHGDKIIAMQGQPGTAQSKVVDVPTVVALNTPLAQSSQAFIEAHNRKQGQQPQVIQPAHPQVASILT